VTCLNEAPAACDPTQLKIANCVHTHPLL